MSTKNQNKNVQVNIYKYNAFSFRVWHENSLIMVEAAGPMPGMESKMPKAGEQKYNWEHKLRMSLSPMEAMELAAAAECVRSGRAYSKNHDFFEKDRPKDSKAMFYFGIFHDSGKSSANVADKRAKRLAFVVEQDGKVNLWFAAGSKADANRPKPLSVNTRYQDLYTLEAFLKTAAAALLNFAGGPSLHSAILAPATAAPALAPAAVNSTPTQPASAPKPSAKPAVKVEDDLPEIPL